MSIRIVNILTFTLYISTMVFSKRTEDLTFCRGGHTLGNIGFLYFYKSGGGITTPIGDYNCECSFRGDATNGARPRVRIQLSISSIHQYLSICKSEGCDQFMDDTIHSVDFSISARMSFYESHSNLHYEVTGKVSNITIECQQLSTKTTPIYDNATVDVLNQGPDAQDKYGITVGSVVCVFIIIIIVIVVIVILIKRKRIMICKNIFGDEALSASKHIHEKTLEEHFYEEIPDSQMAAKCGSPVTSGVAERIYVNAPDISKSSSTLPKNGNTYVNNSIVSRADGTETRAMDGYIGPFTGEPPYDMIDITPDVGMSGGELHNTVDFRDQGNLGNDEKYFELTPEPDPFTTSGVEVDDNDMYTSSDNGNDLSYKSSTLNEILVNRNLPSEQEILANTDMANNDLYS